MFPANFSNFQCHNSWRFYDQETFLIIINIENCCAASYFCGILW